MSESVSWHADATLEPCAACHGAGVTVRQATFRVASFRVRWQDGLTMTRLPAIRGRIALAIEWRGTTWHAWLGRRSAGIDRAKSAAKGARR